MLFMSFQLKTELKEMCKQMCTDISHSVTQQVLINLEGAVIASVPGGPLGGVPVPASAHGNGGSTRKLSCITHEDEYIWLCLNVVHHTTGRPSEIGVCCLVIVHTLPCQRV